MSTRIHLDGRQPQLRGVSIWSNWHSWLVPGLPPGLLCALNAALGDSEPCESCSELEVPDSLLGLDIDPPNLVDGSLCPGGPPGVAAFCPYRGLWVDYDDLTLEVRLQSCETSHACNGTVPAKHNGSCREWIVATNASAGAVCGEGRQGLLCGTCMEDYTKVGPFRVVPSC